MEPTTMAALASTLMAGTGKKAAELGRVFIEELDHEESRIRLFLRKLYQKPLSWILTLLFAPLIMSIVVVKILKQIPAGIHIISKIKLIILLFGLCLAGIICWLAGGYLGTISGFFIVKNLFGIISAIGFLFGTTLSVIFTIIFQVIVFNLMCFFFLKVSKDSIIKSVGEEYFAQENTV